MKSLDIKFNCFQQQQKKTLTDNDYYIDLLQ